MLNHSQANDISFMADLEEARLLWAQLSNAYLELITFSEVCGPVVNKYNEIKNLINEAEKIVPNLFSLEFKLEDIDLSEKIITELKSIISDQLLNRTNNRSFAILAHYIEISRQDSEIFTQDPKILKQDCDKDIIFTATVINMFRNMERKFCFPEEIRILIEEKISPIFVQTLTTPDSDSALEAIYINSFLSRLLTAKEAGKMSMLENAYIQLMHVLECNDDKNNVVKYTLNNLTFLSAKWPLLCESYLMIQDSAIENKYSKIEEFISINQLGINLCSEGVEAKLAGLEIKDFVKFTYKVKKLCGGLAYNGNLIFDINGNLISDIRDQIQLNINELSELEELEAKMNLVMPMPLQLQDDLQDTIWKQIKVLRLKYAELTALYDAIIIKSDDLQCKYQGITNLIGNKIEGANGIEQNLLLITEDYVRSTDRQSLELNRLLEELTTLLQESTSLCDNCWNDEHTSDYILTKLRADARAELNMQIWTMSSHKFEGSIHCLADKQAIMVANHLLKEERNRLTEVETRLAAEALQMIETTRLDEEDVVREQAAREQAAREQAAREQAAREQAAREQAAREQAAREQAAREQAARELAQKRKELSPRSPDAIRKARICAEGF